MDRPKQKRFVIFSGARTGSNLLLSLIDSHPGVKCEGELFNPDLKYTRYSDLLRFFKWFPYFFCWYRSRHFKNKVYGYKLHRYQLVNPHKVLNGHNKQGWKIVYLIRRNLFRRALSIIVAEKTNIYIREQLKKPVRIRVSPEEFLYRIVNAEKEHEWNQETLEGIPRLTLTYENDLENDSDHAETGRKLCDFLSIDEVPLTTGFRRTHSQPYSDIIENYEELENFIRLTRYTCFLP